jgi:hypothetical protein
MYELTLDKNIQDGNMIHIYAPEVAGYRLGAVMLGDTQKKLVNYFSNKQNNKAYAMHAYLKDALKAYPDNKKLYDLLVYWQDAARLEKDLKDYGYVDENWRKYNNAKKLYLKASYLRSMLGEINSYLTEHPDGKKVAEARQRKEFAEKKLKEYEPLL